MALTWPTTRHRQGKGIGGGVQVQKKIVDRQVNQQTQRVNAMALQKFQETLIERLKVVKSFTAALSDGSCNAVSQWQAETARVIL